jgi:small redox-active disulfide protein 2
MSLGGREQSHQLLQVGQARIGIVGLREAIEAVRAENPASDVEVAGKLLALLKESNYIPAGAEPEYAAAFLVEYNKATGRPYVQTFECLEIKVLGAGCAACDRLAERIRNLLAEMDLAVNFEHVKDINELARHGVMGTPALLINGEVKIVGRAPSDRQLRTWLEELRKKK